MTPHVSVVRTRPAKRVSVAFRNPGVRTRAGKPRAGTVVFVVDDREFEVHTVYGAAQVLGRSAVRVQQLLERGKLRGYRVGRDWLVLDLDLRRFIKQERAKVRKRFAAFLDDSELDAARRAKKDSSQSKNAQTEQAKR